MYVCDSAATRPSSQITLGRLVYLVHGRPEHCRCISWPHTAPVYAISRRSGPVADASSTVVRFTQCVVGVAEWLSTSRLNQDKTPVVIWLGSRQKVDKITARDMNVLSSLITVVNTVRDLQTYTVLQGSTDQASICLHHLQKPLRNTRSADDTTFVALSARKNPYLFSFSLGLLPIGTNCHANSAWNHQLIPSVSLCTVHRLINRNSQPWHSSGNGLVPIAGYLPKNRRTLVCFQTASLPCQRMSAMCVDRRTALNYTTRALSVEAAKTRCSCICFFSIGLL